MLKKLFKSLESVQNPLLGPNLRGLKFTGMLQKENSFQKVLYNFIHAFASLFVLTQFIELWIIRTDLANALRNLSISMLSTVCVVKAWTFISWEKYWKDIIESISKKELTQIEKLDSTTNRIISRYIKYSRAVTYFYWALVTATVFTVIMAPLVSYVSSSELREAIQNGTSPYPEIMSSWVPFEKTKSYGYWAYVLEHTMICFYGGGIVAAYDSNAVGIMTFFSGQLNLLQKDCERLFGEDGKILNDEKSVANIRECHYQHLFLIKVRYCVDDVQHKTYKTTNQREIDSETKEKTKTLNKELVSKSLTTQYSKMFNSVLSPVMFLYVIICSLMICCSAIQLTDEKTTTMQQIWIAEYLLALIAQLFFYCWHGNEVLHMSLQVDMGVYSSAWWMRNVRLRRAVLLLAGQLRRRVVFNAGPFTTLTVPTFVAILKGSYSYYTILSKNND